MEIQAGACPDISRLWCPRWTEGGFPLFPSNYVQPSCFAQPLRQSVAFGFLLAFAALASSICCSQRAALPSEQTNALALLFTQTRLVRSARPRCTPANLCDAIEAGALNASSRANVARVCDRQAAIIFVWGAWWIQHQFYTHKPKAVLR